MVCSYALLILYDFQYQKAVSILNLKNHAKSKMKLKTFHVLEPYCFFHYIGWEEGCERGP